VNSPVSSLLVGDRLVSRCVDGLLEAEYALFDRSEVLLSPRLSEDGYMTRAGLARARLYEALVTADLAYEAFAVMRGRLIRPLLRSPAVGEVIDQLGPYETFQGGRFIAERRRYTGVWLDLDALAGACPLPDASILLQALHLVLVLEEVADDAPVRLLTSQTGNPMAGGGRTWRRVDLEPAQRLPWAIRETQVPAVSQGSAYDEAEIRDQIVRDLHARSTATAIAQPRLGALAAAVAASPYDDAVLPTRVIVVDPAPPPAAIVPAAPPRPPVEQPAPATVVQRTTAALAVRTARMAVPPQDPPLEDRRLLDPRLVLLSEPDSQRSAAYRLLRDNLLARKALRIIAVSSGSVHEGKTTCAINLALALSEKPSTRVLLMEGNFFVPSLGAIFRIDATTRPDPQLNLPVLLPYRIAPMMRGLHVAALVQQPGEPAPAFNSRWFEMVIDHLAGADYDHLVIDAAALDGSPAVTQVLGVADGTLLTVRSQTSTARSLRRAAEQIPEGRALGVTLIDGDARG
jgi:Mrp family chromosome partitioning ATPase